MCRAMLAGNHPLPLSYSRYNEEKNIAHSVWRASHHCLTYIVVDSGSTDRTLEICKADGAALVHHSYSNHGSQWQWSLENLAIETPWVLVLDADFV